MSLKTKLKWHHFLCLIILCQPMQSFGCFFDGISKAERLFAEGLYADAAPLYEQMVRLSAGTNQELLYRLAYCHLENRAPQSALDLLSSFQPLALIDSEFFFLMGISHRQLKNYRQALHFLEKITVPARERLIQQIQFEKGLNFFFLHQDAKAQVHFQSIAWDGRVPSLYFSAQLYLARLALLHNRPDQAREIIECFEIPVAYPLGIEKAYLHGVSHYLQKDYLQAIAYFQQVLDYLSPHKPVQSIVVLRHLTAAYLCAVNQPGLDSNQVHDLLAESKSALDRLFKLSQTENDYFLLGDFLLTQAQLLDDPASFQAAQELFKREDVFVSSYKEANLRLAFNVYKEGVRCLQQNRSSSQAARCFNEAAQSFETAYTLLIDSNPERAYEALKYYALSCLCHPTQDNLVAAALLMQSLIDNPPPSFTIYRKQDEILYLAGILWKRQAPRDSKVTERAEQALIRAANFTEDSLWTIASGIELGAFYFQIEQWEKAYAAFTRLSKKHPSCIEAIFWLALCAEKLQEPQHKQALLKTLYAQNPQGQLAPLAYFYTYNYRGYMQGHRSAIKHLQAMPSLFPSHPLAINAYYLIGLDYKKDHLSERGTLLRQKDLIAAIDAFLQAELSFDHLFEKKLIPTPLISYYMCLHDRAMLERALANLAIGESAQGAKRQIYFEYALQVFLNLMDRLKNSVDLTQKQTNKNDTQRAIWEESLYGLAQAYIKKGEREAAEKILNESLAYYAAIEQQYSYLLSQTWYEKGKIAFEYGDFSNALLSFQQAEASSQAQALLSPDQKIEVWIQQSHCYKEIGELDKAMLILSKAVNDEAISSLRVKAMYLRADLYELQGRPELALKQLKATANKGGPWGLKAKEKLKDYGY